MQKKQSIYIRNMMYLFDYVYKKGVVDAGKVNDHVFCQEFIERMSQPNMFGNMLDDYTVTWREWRDILSQWSGYADAKHMSSVLINIRGYSGYLACILPISMDFYMKGISDYSKAPNSSYIPIFKQNRLELWGEKDKHKKLSILDYAGLSQQFAWGRMRTDKEVGLSETSYNAFNIWIYDIKAERSTFIPKRIKI